MSLAGDSEQAGNRSATRERWQGGRLPRAEVDQRIARLLDIALEEFALHGFGGTSLDRLVERSGVSKTTMYRRFGNKEGLFTTLIHQNVRAIHHRLWTLEFDLDDPEGTIERFVTAYTEVAVRHPQGRTLLEIALGGKNAFPHLGAVLVENAYEGFRPVSDYIGQLMEAGVLSRGDPQEAAFELQGLITHGFRVLVDDLSFLSRPGRSTNIARRFLKAWG